MSKKKY